MHSENFRSFGVMVRLSPSRIRDSYSAELICAKRNIPPEAIFKRFQNEFMDLNRETKVRKFSN